MVIRRDCFAYGTAKRCRILTEVICGTDDCKFYKTKKQYREDFKKYPPLQSRKNMKKGATQNGT